MLIIVLLLSFLLLLFTTNTGTHSNILQTEHTSLHLGSDQTLRSAGEGWVMCSVSDTVQSGII